MILEWLLTGTTNMLYPLPNLNALLSHAISVPNMNSIFFVDNEHWYLMSWNKKLYLHKWSNPNPMHSSQNPNQTQPALPRKE